LTPIEPRDGALAFAKVSDVHPDRPDGWEGKLFLTFDIDWAHDEVILDVLGRVEAAGVSATWFVTHDTPVLARIRENPLFELGIHPNFLPLLNGNGANGANAEEIVDRLLAVVPEAKAVRSHSLVQSGRLLELFRRKGLTHECNVFIPGHSGIILRPWIDWFGMIRVPYFWEDDFHCEADVSIPIMELLDRPGLHGFDFHPIHAFLNTDSMARYEGARDCFHAPERLIQHRNSEGEGVADLLAQLLGTAQ
jgi:hypothetical protein